MSARACPVQADGLVGQAAGSELLVYSPEADAVHVLNATAQAVWALCDGRHTPAEIEAALRAGFAGAGERDVAEDVGALLARLEAEGLIAWAPAPPEGGTAASEESRE